MHIGLLPAASDTQGFFLYPRGCLYTVQHLYIDSVSSLYLSLMLQALLYLLLVEEMLALIAGKLYSSECSVY